MEKKKSYTKPEIQRVELTPDEAVLAHCKNTGTNKSVTNLCRTSRTLCANSTKGS